MTEIVLDTADGRLARHALGVSRDADPGGGTGAHRWTLRLPAEVGKATFDTRVHTWVGVADPPPPSLRSLLVGVLGGRALVPVEGRVDLGPVPPSPPEAGTVAAAVGAALTGAFTKLVDQDLGLRLGGHPEFVHQARVATRTLRSDLRTFRPLLDRAWAEDVRGELKWLADLLGAVRDLDVFTERLEGRRAGLGPAALTGWETLGLRLEEQHGAATATLRQALDSERYLALLGRLERYLAVPPWAAGTDPGADARPVLARLVRKPWRRLRHDVKALGPEPDSESLHDMRKRAKQVRYACEAVAPTVGPPAARLGKRAKALQSVLGDHQDAVASQEWLHRVLVDAGASEAFAAGQAAALDAQDQADAARQWPAVWRAMERKQLRFW